MPSSSIATLSTPQHDDFMVYSYLPALPVQAGLNQTVPVQWIKRTDCAI